MERKRITWLNRFLKPENILTIAAAAFILAALSLLSAQNYLLFHSIIEIVTIVIAFSLFILVWNNRGIIADTFFLIIGISVLFTGSIDLLHTLAYKGMGVFPGITSDLPTQLWIAARYFQSIAFLIATLYIGKSITRDRRYDIAIIITGCTIACGLLLASIFIWQDFPACFIEGTGLTPFKIVSEYIISLILVVTVGVLYARRHFFDPEVWRFLVAAQVFLVLGELAFTTYASVYGFTNMLGHLFKLVSFYLFYRAIVVVGITRPYDLLFRDLVENINDVIFTMDSQGRIVYISPVISQQYGYVPEAVMGQEFIWFIHQDDRSRFQAWFLQSKEGERGENVFRISTQDGRERYVRTSVCPLVRAGMTGMFTCTLADITEHRRAEENLREQYSTLRGIIDSAHALIFSVDRHYRYTSFNKGHATIMKALYGAEIEPGHSILEYMTVAEDRETARHNLDRALAGEQLVEEAYSGEELRSRKYFQVSHSPIRTEGEIIGVAVLAQDMTERKRAEEALQKSGREWQTTFDAITDAVFLLDNEGRIIRHNRAFETYTGKPAAEIDGRYCYDILHGTVYPIEGCPNVKAQKNRQRESLELKIGDRWFVAIVDPVFSDSGEISGTVHLLIDITARKRMEVELHEVSLYTRNLIEVNLDPLVTISPEGRITDVNTATEMVTGLTRNELNGTDFSEYFTEPEKAREGYRRVFSEGKVLDYPLEIRHRDGYITPVLYNATVYCDSNGNVKGVFAAARDITERKKAETVLARINRALRMLSDSNQALIHITDEVLLMNEICRIAVDVGGYRMAWIGFAEQDEAKTVRPVAHAGDESGYLMSANVTWADTERGCGPGGTAIRTGQPSVARNIPVDPAFAPWRAEAMRRGYQSIIALPLTSDGTTFGAMGIYASEAGIFDSEEVKILTELADDLAFGITALRTRARRELAEEELRKNEERLIMAQEIGHTGSWEYNLQTGKLWRSAEGARIIGLLPGAGDVSMEQIEAGIPERGRVHQALVDLIEHDQEYKLEFAINPADGSARKEILSVARLEKDASGNPLRVVGVMQDITERKQAEERIRAALAEKVVLLREIHHRVKNNLAGVISIIDLQIDSQTDPAHISLLRDLETRIRSMALVHESLYQTKDLTHVNFAEYTENLILYLFEVYSAGTDIRYRIEMGDITLPIGTALPCGMVMTEIVTNTLKYAFPGTFSCNAERGEPSTIVLSLTREGKYYQLMISDNGIGLPEGMKIAPPRSLGLHLIRFIVTHQMRGTIEVSTVNGTAYTIRFSEPDVREHTTYG